MRDLLHMKVLVLHPWTNLLGMLGMGAFPGLGPGQILKKNASEEAITLGAVSIDFEKRRKVIYLIGEVPHAALPEADFLIYQNALPCSFSRQPDLLLPASLFAESSGTITTANKRVLHIHQAVEPFGDSKPDWWILTRIAEKMGKGKLKYTSVAAVQQEIKKQVKGTADSKRRLESAPVRYAETATLVKRRPQAAGPGAAGPYPAAWNGHADAYRGIALAEVVEGMKVIAKRSRNE
jgi:NADH dehydrogenase/NADH:ubiquinone oxidoreductase subunit G